MFILIVSHFLKSAIIQLLLVGLSNDFIKKKKKEKKIYTHLRIEIKKTKVQDLQQATH